MFECFIAFHRYIVVFDKISVLARGKLQNTSDNKVRTNKWGDRCLLSAGRDFIAQRVKSRPFITSKDVKEVL